MNASALRNQPWIYSPCIDGIFILLPSILALTFIFIFPDFFSNEAEVSPLSWIILILLIDVAHVYSTLYRTYFDKDVFQQHKTLLIYTPFICGIISIVIYGIDAMLFWRCLAYIAVFHFIRQQYGFMRIYSRKDVQNKWFRIIDNIAIYYATLFPIIYWHLHAPRKFNWFVSGDFYYFKSDFISIISEALYFAVIILYICKEAVNIKKHGFNFPKNVILMGTFLSWYFGIIYFNGDLTFTALNVVSHGIPYMALVWIYGRKKFYGQSAQKNKSYLSRIFSNYGLPVFLLIIFLFAFVEEGIWEGLVWKEQREIFKIFNFHISPGKEWMAIIVSVLTVPQLTHYIIDGFIWKMNNDKFDWKRLILGK